MKALVLAGGSGTRLWPLSRKNYPKQFLKLNGDESLLRQTVGRLLKRVTPDDIVVITSGEYKFYVKSDLAEINHVLLEPTSRNTAPAIALGVKYCQEKLGSDKNEVIFVCPSDHVIRPVGRFLEYLEKAEALAKDGHLVTFGIKPDRPETGYGYIKVGEKPKGTEESHSYRVEKFVEKPDAATAKRYLEEGRYYWNSGMFAFTISTIVDEYLKHSPEIHKFLGSSYGEMMDQFGVMPEISIDFAIMERSEKVVTLPLDLYWNDIGSWDSLYEILSHDEDGNGKIGDVITIGTRNSLIFGGKRLISTIGLEDCLVVETDDAILIGKRGETAKVKDVVSQLKGANRKEATEHVTSYRPWGSYTILEEGLRYKIKRVVVNPEEKLSLQRHSHRSEHWVVVRGTAKAVIGEKEFFVHENESVYVPKSAVHRLENAGKIPVEIIEVQSGEYLDEDDIERFSDVYDRS